MAWLEMSRTPDERPPGWQVGECLWSPRKNSLGHPSGFWEKMRDVVPGDVVFHLCGSRAPMFVGHSVAASGCTPIELGPPGPTPLYRVELSGFERLKEPLPLAKVFSDKNQALRDYFHANRSRGRKKERLFYVIQAGRLQCQNGAYLSYLSDALIRTLFEIDVRTSEKQAAAVPENAATAESLGSASRRLGQQAFSQNVRDNWKGRCCFPGCDISDKRFLVGSHIARWADVPALRGRTDNGLCLCLLHDKAFEVGAFTLNANHRIVVGKKEPEGSWLHILVASSNGKSIAPASITPCSEALNHHWTTHGFDLR